MAHRKAFTLIELLIVITIIGILAVALVPRISQGPARARDVQRKADLQQVATALEMYYADHGEYPNIDFDGSRFEEDCVSDGATDIELGDTLSTYMTVPSDPSDGEPTDCSNDYYYMVMTYSDGGSSPSSYALIAEMEIVPGNLPGYFCDDAIDPDIISLSDFIYFIEGVTCSGDDAEAFYTVYH